MKFRPHGKADFRIEGQLILIDLEGPWNAELVEQIHERLAGLKATLTANGKWGLVFIISNSLLCPLETLDTIRRSVLDDAAHNGHAAVGVVAARSVEGRGLLEAWYCKLYEGICPVAFFETLDEAKCWIAPYLARNS
jgi:hypothetical protein